MLVPAPAVHGKGQSFQGSERLCTDGGIRRHHVVTSAAHPGGHVALYPFASSTTRGREQTFEQALEATRTRAHVRGGGWAVLISFVALVMSGFSLYETTLKRAALLGSGGSLSGDLIVAEGYSELLPVACNTD